MGTLQSVEEGFPPSPQAGAATPELIDRKLESALASASPRAQKAIQQVAELVRRQSQIQPWVEQREDEFRQRENELQWREIELDGTAAELERSFKADMELQATNMETIAAHAAALRMHESKEAQLTSALQEMESTNVKLHKTTADSETLLLQKHAASMSHASAQMAAQAEAHKANGVELQATNMETIAAHAAALRMHESKEAQLTSALQEMERTNGKLTTALDEARDCAATLRQENASQEVKQARVTAALQESKTSNAQLASALEAARDATVAADERAAAALDRAQNDFRTALEAADKR